MNNSHHSRKSVLACRWAGLLLSAAVSMLCLAGCDQQSADPRGDNALATWNNGNITADEFDAYLLKKHGVGLSLPDALEDRQDFWRDELQELALSRIWQQESIEQSVDDTPEFLRLYRNQMREATVQALLKKNGYAPPAEDTEALQTLFASRQQQYAQPERRVVYNLFIKANDKRTVEASRDLAQQLRANIRDHFTFQEMARQHSDSETRLSGGLVGIVARDQLSNDLAELIFSMQANRASRVVKSKTGAHLFFVTEIMPAVVPEFSHYRQRLHRDMMADHLAKQEQELIKQLQPLPTLQLPDREEFKRLMSLDEGDPIVLDVGDYLLHRSEFNETLQSNRKNTSQHTQEGAGGIKLAWGELQKIARHEQIFQSLRISEPEMLRQLSEDIKPAVLLSVIADRKIAAWFDSNQAKLKEFFEKNIGDYQRSELLLVRTLTIPAEPPIAAQVKRVEGLLNSVPNTQGLEQIADQLGIDLKPEQWIERARLFKHLPRIANQVDSLAEGGISSVYAVGDHLVVSELLGRKQPAAPDYAALKHRVETDFRATHLQRIYAQLKGVAMEQSGFAVDQAMLADYVPGLRMTTDKPQTGD